MIKKLVVILVSGAICLGIVPLGLAQTGPGEFCELAEYEQIVGKKLVFNEAPMFEKMVTAGDIPSLEKRLPEEPLVVTPVEEIGQYGGILNTYLVSADMWNPPAMFGYEPMLILNRTVDKIIPNIAKGWKFSGDNKTFTLYLRKGMKWSDGVPFTADDIIFWWEDIVLNDEITPVKPGEWMPGGELMKVEKIGDYTVQYQFASSNPNITIQFSSVGEMGYQSYCFAPKHALKNYHIKYNPEANELAKEEGYDYWWELFNYKNDYGPIMRRAGIPTLDPWIVEKETPIGVTFMRNPYYWKVDTAGNQLPYIDKIRAPFVTDTEVRIMKMVSGEIEFDPGEIMPERYPFLKENEEKGGYKVWNVEDTGLSSVAFFAFNQNYEEEDPVLAKILQNAKFRQALSLAIDRQEINDLYFFGRGRACQVTAYDTCSFYEESWAESYAEYNPEIANELLDEIGLEKGEDGYRRRPDGEILGLRILVLAEAIPVWISISELAQSYWGELGIKVEVKPSDFGYLWEQAGAGKHQVVLWVMDGMTEFQFISSGAGRFGVFGGEPHWWAPKWAIWWNTKEEEEPGGEEPPEEIKILFSMAEMLPCAGKEEANRIARYICSMHAEKLYYVGTVGYLAGPRVAAVNLKNIDMVHNYTGHAIGAARHMLAEQLFLEE